MAINIYQLPKPYIQLTLVAWWTLTVWQEYFFIWFLMAWLWYYWNAVGGASDQVSIIPTAWMQSIKSKYWSRWGNITQAVDAGSGYTTIFVDDTTNMTNWQTVEIEWTTSYNWTHTISSLWPDSYNINIAYVADETWISLHQAGRPSDISAPRQNWITYKRDKYSMLKANWDYYRRQNLNDPYFTSEYNTTAWHRNWTHWYYYQGDPATERVYTEEKTSYSSYSLMDWRVASSVVTGQLRHPQVAQRIWTYQVYDWFNHEKWRLLIIADWEWHTRNDLINALEASPHQDMYILYNNYSYRSNVRGILLNAHFQSFTNDKDFVFEDFDITLLWWHFDYAVTVAEFVRCFVTLIWTQSSTRYNDRNYYIDSNSNYLGNSYIMDNVTSDNSWFTGSLTWYDKSPIWFNLIWWYAWASPYFQWRYQRIYPKWHSSYSIMKNFNIKDYAIYMTDSAQAGGVDIWWTMENVNFDWLTVSRPYNVYISFDRTVDNTWKWMDCYNVTSTENDWKLILRRTGYGWNTWTYDQRYFRYWLDLTILDIDWNPIEWCEIKLESDIETSTATSDVDWLATVIALWYDIYFDQSYEYWETSEWKKQKLLITKAWFETYEVNGFEIREWQSWIIKLKKANQFMIDTNWDINILSSPAEWTKSGLIQL